VCVWGGGVVIMPLLTSLHLVAIKLRSFQ